jgi:hypothetical protein
MRKTTRLVFQLQIYLTEIAHMFWFLHIGGGGAERIMRFFFNSLPKSLSVDLAVDSHLVICITIVVDIFHDELSPMNDSCCASIATSE